MDRETVEAINLFAGMNIQTDGKEEVIDMCKAWEEQREEGIEQGIEQGIERGIEQGIGKGIEQKNLSLAKMMIEGNEPIDKIAKYTGYGIDRIKEIAEQLSDNDITEKVQSIAVDTKGDKRKSKPVHYDDVTMGQMTLSDTVKDEDIIQELKEIDITNLTPMDAMNTLYRLQNKLNNRWSV